MSNQNTKAMKFSLPQLPYAKNALEPFISEKTIEFHYGKHHQTYIDNLNKLIVGTEFENMGLEEIILKSTGSIYNNAAQVWNHTFYWNCLKPDSVNIPTPPVLGLIEKHFGSFSEFKDKFTTACTTLFGSGWVFLVMTPENTLEIIQEPNAGNPILQKKQPLLVCDVWEHAYYLDKQNKRPDYINDFWKLVDWEAIEERL